MSAFAAGAEMIRILEMYKDAGRQELLLELVYLALWLAIGLRWGRGAWECTNQRPSDVNQGGTA